MQREIIQSVLDGHDTLGLLPTGGGKSITFQVPALMLEGLTLVITPLISLMKDQVDNLRKIRVKATYIHSGLTNGERNLAIDRCRLGIAKILYLSPEKLLSESFLDELRFFKISLIVVDEAHCISQWGYDFRPSYLKIEKIRNLFPNAPVLALTATATHDVVEDIIKNLGFKNHNILSNSFKRENLSYIVRRTEDKQGQLLRILSNVDGSIIVYVRSRKRAKELAELLRDNDLSADFYHAGLLPEEKNQKQNKWSKGEIRIIVATNAFGMGIDKSDVRAVVHYDIPSSLEEYYQEVGRGGRDDKHAWAVALISVADKGVLTRRLNESFPPKDFIKNVYDKAGVFLGVAIGDGFNRTYDFNFNIFCERFNLPTSPTRNSMEILTQAGLFEFNEDMRSSARLMILLRKEELYNLRIDNEADRILNQILRMYPGLFSDYVYINEQLIASHLDLTPQTVYEALLRLARNYVIHYVPRRSTPYLYYPTSREEVRHVVIPRTVYEDRRSVMEKRIKSMSDFIFSHDECRSKTILRYFGEENVEDCGHCDVCRAKNKSIRAEETKRLKKSVEYLLSNGHDITYILAQFSSSQQSEVIEIIRSKR
ncbi:MAG: RecQ family ATP-dependent DNA helicase [Muribaculaceae bacterium]|nr:RecQ family ATP-dependent DNA helicase [Muribaculaceae bacterium]